jgi:hypothetical protein
VVLAMIVGRMVGDRPFVARLVAVVRRRRHRGHILADRVAPDGL